MPRPALVVLILPDLPLRLPAKATPTTWKSCYPKLPKFSRWMPPATFARTTCHSRCSTLYSWGGFLTWALPEYPVFIDGRTDLYGDAINLPYFKATTAETPLQPYSGFAQAQTILLKSIRPSAQALATLPGFRVAYKDGVAVVLFEQSSEAMKVEPAFKPASHILHHLSSRAACPGHGFSRTL